MGGCSHAHGGKAQGDQARHQGKGVKKEGQGDGDWGAERDEVVRDGN